MNPDTAPLDKLPDRKLKVSQEELDRERIPYHKRDYCVQYLIPLNRCRRQNFYLPGTCEEELLKYERCEYKSYLRRVKLAQQYQLDHVKERIRKEEEQKNQQEQE